MHIYMSMGCGVCWRKMLGLLLVLAWDTALGERHLLKGELTVVGPVEIPVATIYSPTVHCAINLDKQKKLCQKAIDKQKKFKNPNILVVQNMTSGFFHIFIGGLIPQKDLLMDEIDILKVLGCGKFRNHFIQLLENPSDVKRKTLATIKEEYENYLQKINEYIVFFATKFDGADQKNIQKLLEQFQILWNNLKEGMRRVHAEDLAAHLKKINQSQLNLPGNPPFKSFCELFQPEMLLLHAMENDVVINDFRFGAFIQQNPLNIGLYSDMLLLCETLYARFSKRTDRADKQLIVSSVSPAKHSTRIANFQFPQYIFLSNFIKVAFQEKECQR